MVHEYGAHIFRTSDSEIWEYIKQFAAFNHFVNSPIAKYKDELYNLPFNMNTFSKMWNISTPKEALEIIQEQGKSVTLPTRNLEEYAISLVGTDIYEKLIKGYTEKQWEEVVKSYLLLLCVEFRCGLFTIITILMTGIREFR